MDSFDPIPSTPPLDENVEGFQEVPLPPSPKVDELSELETEHEATQWSTKSLKRFQVPPATENDMEISFPDEEIAQGGVDLEIDPPQAITPPVPQALQPPLAPAAETSSPMTEAQIEKMVREQAKSLIEAIVWKVVPDLATQIIERELNRLLADKNP